MYHSLKIKCQVSFQCNLYVLNNNYLCSLSVPIPTYILGPTEKQEMSYFSPVSLDNGGEMCENLTYLGKNACLKWY